MEDNSAASFLPLGGATGLDTSTNEGFTDEGLVSALDAAKSVKAYPPVNWWSLNDFERGELLETLAVWVPSFCRFYAVNEQIIAPCWYRHNNIIQELLALYQLREQLLLLPNMHAGASQDLHFQIQQTLTRVRQWRELTGCNAREHFESILPAWTTTESGKWVLEFTQYLDTQGLLHRHGN